MTAWWLQIAGLVVGFLGALFLTISQRPGDIFSGGPGGREVAYVVLKYPWLWTGGLWLLCGGFGLQGASIVMSSQ